MVSSVRVDPGWLEAYLQLSRNWLQANYDAIRAAGQLSRQISASTQQAYEARRASDDRVYREISEQIRGVETYDDPLETYPVQLPSDYEYAWRSSAGGYVLSNDAGFDPNVGSTQTFTLLEPTD